MSMIPPPRRLPCQKLDSAGDAPANPSGSDTGCHIGLLLEALTGSIAMDELDLIGDAGLRRGLALSR